MAKLVDLTGQKFGKLVVLHRDVCKEKEKNNNTTYWKCKCECGNEISVASGSLKSGNTRSCGCLMTELKRQRRTDLTNRRFGKLIVLYRTEDYIDSYNKHHSKWHCQCDCGNECDVLEASLKQNLTQSCGCLHKEIVSKMFLKDIRRYDDNGNLIAKLCPTCKEWRDIEQFYKHNYSVDGYSGTCKICCKYRLNERYGFYKANAQRRNLEFELTLDQFDDITQRPCVYCGNYNGTYKNILFSGIDRIDSNKGYIEENIVPCCDICNKMKGVLPTEQWLQHMQLILQHFKEEINE